MQSSNAFERFLRFQTMGTYEIRSSEFVGGSVCVCVCVCVGGGGGGGGGRAGMKTIYVIL